MKLKKNYAEKEIKEECCIIKKLRKYKEIMYPITWNPIKYINQGIEFCDTIDKAIDLLKTEVKK